MYAKEEDNDIFIIHSYVYISCICEIFRNVGIDLHAPFKNAVAEINANFRVNRNN